MKYLYLLFAVLLMRGGAFASAPQDDSLAHVPMTSMERAIMKISNSNDLKTFYDTLKTDYDRQWFINALPKYFVYNKNSAVPGWMNQILLDGIHSNSMLLINESVRTAGILQIQCVDDIIALYKKIHPGSQEFMVKASIFNALGKMDGPNKQQFLYDVLTKEKFPILNGVFSALLHAIDGCRSAAFDSKLAEYSSKLSAVADSLQLKGEEKAQACRVVLDQVNKIRNHIALDAAQGVKGGAK